MSRKARSNQLAWQRQFMDSDPSTARLSSSRFATVLDGDNEVIKKTALEASRPGATQKLHPSEVIEKAK